MRTFYLSLLALLAAIVAIVAFAPASKAQAGFCATVVQPQNVRYTGNNSILCPTANGKVTLRVQWEEGTSATYVINTTKDVMIPYVVPDACGTGTIFLKQETNETPPDVSVERQVTGLFRPCAPKVTRE